MLQDFTQGNIKDHRELVLYCDGACEPKNPGGVATAGWAFADYAECKDGIVPEKALAQEAQVVRDGRGHHDPKATNNYAEYCALGRALRFLADNNWHGGFIQVYSDSKLLVNQISAKWKCNKEHLQELRVRIWELLDQLGVENSNMDMVAEIDDTGFDPEVASPSSLCIKWVPRDLTEYADGLSKLAYEEYVGSQPPPRPKKSPPKKKVKPGNERFKCKVCGYGGTIKELHIEDGNLACPVCSVGDVEFL